MLEYLDLFAIKNKLFAFLNSLIGGVLVFKLDVAEAT